MSALTDALDRLSPRRAHQLMDRLGVTHDALEEWAAQECPCRTVQIAAYLEELTA